MIDKRAKAGDVIWFDEWSGVKMGTVVHASEDGGLHVQYDDRVESIAYGFAFTNEADAWDHRASRAVRDANEKLTVAVEAMQKPATCRTLAPDHLSRAA